MVRRDLVEPRAQLRAALEGIEASPRAHERVLHHFLEPTFAESRFHEELHPGDALTFGGMTLGTLLALAGSVVSVDAPAVVRRRFPGYEAVSWFGLRGKTAIHRAGLGCTLAHGRTSGVIVDEPDELVGTPGR